jgi:hypothetical protein
MALLFIACVVFLVLIERGCVLAQTLRKLTPGNTPLIGRWLAVGSRKP